MAWGVFSSIQSFFEALRGTTSTSHQQDPTCSVRKDLEKLSQMLARIQAVQQDAEEREIHDCSVLLWLAELRGVGYQAEDVSDEFYYEVLRSIVESGDVAIEAYIDTGVIDIPITDGKIDREKEIDIAASAFILRVRSRLNHESKTGAEKTDIEKDIDTAASAFIRRMRSRLDHENKTGTGKTDREEDIDAAASEFIRRVRSRLKSQP